MTPAEKKLWYDYLRHQASQKFLRQRPIGEFIVDFYCAAKGLVVEVDGDSHFVSKQAVDYDLEREKVLREKFKLRVLRVSNLEVLRDFEGVCGVIEEGLR